MTGLASSSAALRAASEKWRTIIGAARVVDSGPAWEVANAPCCGRHGRIAVLLRPADVQEAGACIAVASCLGLALHVVSRGCNWGYGSMQPPSGQAAVLSLERLTAIRVLDPTLARVRVEPGATFGAVAARVEQDAPGLAAPRTGAGPDVSLLGNALAGGVGKAPYGWMARRVADLAFLLPDGRLERAPDVARLPAGAAVVEADFRLLPASDYEALAWARVSDGTEGFEAAFRLALSLEHGETAELLNGPRVRLQSPALNDPPGQRAHDGWLLGVFIAGRDEAETASRLARTRRRLADLPGREAGFEGPQARARPAPIGREGLASAYVPIGREPPLDAHPDRDGCGLRWVALLLPRDGAEAAAALAALGACAERYGFVPALAVRFPDGDPLGLLGLFWSRRRPPAEVAAADARAAQCAAECRDVARRLGLLLHRDRPD